MEICSWKIIERSGLCVPWSSEEELHGIKIYGLLAIGHRSHGGNPRILGTKLAILDRLPTPLDWYHVKSVVAIVLFLNMGH